MQSHLAMGTVSVQQLPPAWREQEHVTVSFECHTNWKHQAAHEHNSYLELINNLHS